MGRRHSQVTQYAGYFELPPSGGIPQSQINADGTVDFRAQVLAELEEEVGISQSQVKTLSPFALVYDFKDSCYDICMEIEVDLDLEDVQRQFSGNKEYSALTVIPIEGIDRFLQDHDDQLVPTSRAILEYYFLKLDQKK